MKDVAEAFRPHFLFRQAGVVQYRLIRGQKCAVGPERDDELRYGIDDCSKFSFGFRKLFERTRECRLVALALIDICLQDATKGGCDRLRSRTGRPWTRNHR